MSRSVVSSSCCTVVSHQTAAARAAAGLIGTAATFELALAAGAPWGAAAWGGQHPGVLPRRLRWASAAGALALGSLAVIVATPTVGSLTTRRRLLLGAMGYFALGTAVNAASRSPVERAIWTPVSATTAGLLWWAARTGDLPGPDGPLSDPIAARSAVTSPDVKSAWALEPFAEPTAADRAAMYNSAVPAYPGCHE